MTDLEAGAGRTCFIVAPIGNRLEPHGSPGRARWDESSIMWEEVIEPACSTFGLAPIRADRISETGEIPDQIFEYLRDAEIVIADLSHGNPNVMYELGLRHSRPGITIQIGEYGLLPFDVTTIRTIQFNRTTAGLIAARDELIEALRTALEGGGGLLRATRIFQEGTELASDAVAADVARSVAPPPDAIEPDEPPLLEVMAEGESAIGHVSEALGRSAARMTAIGEITNAAAARMPSSFAGRLVVARELASELRPDSEGFEADVNEVYADVRSIDAMVRWLFERLESGEESVEGTRGFLEGIIALAEVADETAVGMTSFRNSAPQLRRTARELEPVSRTLEAGATRYLEAVAIISAWRGPAAALLAAE